MNQQSEIERILRDVAPKASFAYGTFTDPCEGWSMPTLTTTLADSVEESLTLADKFYALVEKNEAAKSELKNLIVVFK